MSKSLEAFPYPVLTDQENNDDYYNSFWKWNSAELKENEASNANDLKINYQFYLKIRKLTS